MAEKSEGKTLEVECIALWTGKWVAFWTGSKRAAEEVVRCIKAYKSEPEIAKGIACGLGRIAFKTGSEDTVMKSVKFISAYKEDLEMVQKISYMFEKIALNVEGEILKKFIEKLEGMDQEKVSKVVTIIIYLDPSQYKSYMESLIEME